MWLRRTGALIYINEEIVVVVVIKTVNSFPIIFKYNDKVEAAWVCVAKRFQFDMQSANLFRKVSRVQFLCSCEMCVKLYILIGYARIDVLGRLLDASKADWQFWFVSHPLLWQQCSTKWNCFVRFRDESIRINIIGVFSNNQWRIVDTLLLLV